MRSIRIFQATLRILWRYTERAAAIELVRCCWDEELFMGPLVCMGTGLMCTFGVAPSTMVPSPSNVAASMMPAATIADCAPIVNIPPFGMCISPANPEVIAATAAAMGVLVPMPCVPVPAGTWLPGCPTILIDGVPALDVASTLMCSWGGVITVAIPAQTQVVAIG